MSLAVAVGEGQWLELGEIDPDELGGFCASLQHALLYRLSWAHESGRNCIGELALFDTGSGACAAGTCQDAGEVVLQCEDPPPCE